jgi:hypothetical protein
MHRSATSLVANGLFHAGVFMGHKLLGPGHGNEKGHYEDVELIHLNDRILKIAGGSWDNPPDEFDIVYAGRKIENEIYAAISVRSSCELWGWKDPRTTLTIKCYMPFLRNPVFVPCFRDPMDVAKSLNARDGMPIKAGIRLAGIYNNRLISFLSERVNFIDEQSIDYNSNHPA